LNHFFRGQDHPGGGDQIYFQGHSSPGNYARASLEGRLTEEELDGFRQEKSQAPNGLPSYPHPNTLDNFWQFPTVTRGLGPLTASRPARVRRYVHDRGIKDSSARPRAACLGDGEMDGPGSRGARHFAASNRLDDVTFVIAGNLPRLDGPVRGNGKIVQE